MTHSFSLGIKSPFLLKGHAGVALPVAPSVDTNVRIYPHPKGMSGLQFEPPAFHSPSTRSLRERWRIRTVFFELICEIVQHLPPLLLELLKADKGSDEDNTLDSVGFIYFKLSRKQVKAIRVPNNTRLFS